MTPTFSRRGMLGLMGATGIGAAAAACTDTSDVDGDGTGTEAKDSGLTKTGGNFDIPDPKVDLPTDDVTLRWIDSGDSKAIFYQDFFPEYTKKHPNIKVDYTGTSWNTITEVMTLGLRNGSAPDVFQLPSQITVGMAVSNKWIGAYDDIVPDLESIKARFPAGSFAAGTTDFGGKTYGMPLSSASRFGTLMLYNTDLVKDIDVDLGGDPITWADFRKALKQATQAGDGRYYGIIFSLAQPGGLSGPVNVMTEMAGVHGGAEGIDFRTGEYNMTKPEVAEAVELMLAIKSDGSAHPDSPNLDAPGARERMPQGQAAIMFQGPWNIVPWRETNPEFKLGLNLPPQRDPSDIWPATHGPGGSDTWFYHSKTKLQPVIADIMMYLTTEPAQFEWARHNGAADPPQLLETMDRLEMDPLQNRAQEFGTDYTALRPEPAARNPDITKVYESLVPPDPTFSDTLVGLYTGEDSDSVETALRKMRDRQEKSLEDGIKTAKSRGAKVDRDDWVFPDWDPRKDYNKLYED